MANEIESPYECVDVTLGEYTLLLDSPELEPELRRQVENHLEICDHCRALRAAELKLADDLRSGRLDLRPARKRRGGGAWFAGAGWAGGALAAAGLACALLLPPQPPSSLEIYRDGGELPHVVRPVEGEVVGSAQPTLRWTPITDADSYVVTLVQTDGDDRWEGRTDATEIKVPDDEALAVPGQYRALVEPVPADVAGSREVSVVFETGKPTAAMRHRLAATPTWVRFLGGGGLVLLALALVFRRRP